MAASPTPRPKPADPPGAGPAFPPVDPGCNPAWQALISDAGCDQLALPVAVAYSGGADSSALLRAAAQRWPGQVRALHVHHGLQAAADDFERACAATCAELDLPLQVLRVQARPAPGQSPEDAARRARYTALAQAAQAQGCSAVLLGQHADDQAETLLLALARGAGLPGLAAMAPRFERHDMVFLRPLLGLPGSVLRAWLTEHGHAWVEDPSNADPRLARNRLRLGLMPALADAVPHFRETLARSARHAAQAQALLDEVAAQDLQAVGCPPALAALQALTPGRQAHVLRHWLAAHHGARPSTAQLDELQRQIAACTTRGHRIALKVADGQVRREGPTLVFEPAAP